jgi:hypothetical protein
METGVVGGYIGEGIAVSVGDGFGVAVWEEAGDGRDGSVEAAACFGVWPAGLADWQPVGSSKSRTIKIAGRYFFKLFSFPRY